MAITDKDSFDAKNVEIYVFQIDDYDGFVTTIGSSYRDTNNKTLLGALDAAKTASDISGIKKISDRNNTISIMPSEDNVENRKHFGLNSLGGQNVETVTTLNPDIDITLGQDMDITDDLLSYGLTAETVSGVQIATAHDVTGYKSYNFGNRSSLYMGMLIRIAKQIGYNWHYRNYVFVNPIFKKIGELDGSQDDTVFEHEYVLLGNKSLGEMDFYVSEPAAGALTTPVPETSANFT